VLVDKRDRGHVLECDAAAHELGARPGQTVLQARAATGGGIHVLVHDAARSRIVWHDMLDALDAVSPLVDDSGEGTAYLDMRGIDGTPQVWIARAVRVLQEFDLPVRAAVGPNKFVARAHTYAADGNIGALAVEVLELDPRTIERLHLLGVTKLDDLAKLPHGPFVRRFGKEAAAWHDRARGIDPTPLRARAHEVQIGAAAYGEGSAEQEEQVYFALRVLAERVCEDLSRAGKAASLVQMTFECENGDVRVLDAGFSQATGDPRTMLDVMRAKLEGLTFESPITGLRLQAMQLEECGAAATLFGQNEADPQTLAVVLARLQAATKCVPHRARVRPAVQLEKRFAYDPFTVKALRFVRQADGKKNRHVPQLRLLAVREIDVTMRGNRPRCVDARKVLDCAGPWRIDDGWFAQDDNDDMHVVRDEYDVLLEDGMLCRIYRQGERWYLRGAYD
jgi:nucleotidyltransferase/DNA polymerase involved in DNA repair